MKRSFLNKVLQAANKFGALDFAIFKIYMISIGVILGAYFYSFWIAHILYVWAIAVAAGLYIVIQLIRKYLK